MSTIKTLKAKFNAAQTVTSPPFLLSLDASGNLGKVKPWCCLTPIQVQNTVDLNTIVTPGLYAVSGNCPNSPSDSSSAGLMMFVFEHNPGYIQQLMFAMRLGTPTIYCRNREGFSANWRDWYEVKLSCVVGGG